MLSDLLYRLRALFRRNQVEGEMEEQLRFHIARHVETYGRAGLDRAEVERRALGRGGTACAWQRMCAMLSRPCKTT
jgi:hypothetical protein